MMATPPSPTPFPKLFVYPHPLQSPTPTLPRDYKCLFVQDFKVRQSALRKQVPKDLVQKARNHSCQFILDPQIDDPLEW